MDHEISPHISAILYNQHLRKHRGNATKCLEGKKGMGALLKKSSYSKHSYTFQHRALKSGTTFEGGSSPPFKHAQIYKLFINSQPSVGILRVKVPVYD